MDPGSQPDGPDNANEGVDVVGIGVGLSLQNDLVADGGRVRGHFVEAQEERVAVLTAVEGLAADGFEEGRDLPGVEEAGDHPKVLA